MSEVKNSIAFDSLKFFLSKLQENFPTEGAEETHSIELNLSTQELELVLILKSKDWPSQSSIETEFSAQPFVLNPLDFEDMDSLIALLKSLLMKIPV